MIIPFVDLKIQYQNIKSEIDDVIQDVLNSTSFIKGPYVQAFEKGFAHLNRVKYCIGTSSGTDALHMILWSLGIGSGDYVIVPVNTFIATAEAVSICGAIPLFVDCDEYYNLDIDKINYMLLDMPAEKRERLRAVIPVHLYGQPADMNSILKIARKHELFVIEDACQAHLAQYCMPDNAWEFVGALGIAGAFSFFPGKNLGAYGEAGAAVTNDVKLFDKMNLIHNHGSIIRYHHEMIGHNYRMEAIQGAVLLIKLKYIEKWTKDRQDNSVIYSELLKDLDEITIPKIRKGCTHSFHLYVVQCNKRDDLRHFLNDHGIDTGLHYPIPLHLQQAYSFLGYQRGDFPMAEKMAERILSLPMYPELREEQIRYIVYKIKLFYSRRKR